MADVEDLLREELRVHPSALPDPDALLTRVRRARLVRTAGAGLAGVVSVAAAAVVAVSVVPSGLAGTPTGASPQRVYSAELINTVFTDPQHGYVVQERCSMDVVSEVPDDAPTPDVHRQCAAVMQATSDAGQTWQTRALPGDPATKDAGVELIRGHSLMLWIDPSGALAYGGWNRRYWTTTDGGVTWTESPSPRDLGPAGSYGTFGADDTLTFLQAAPPATVGEKNPVLPATDGSFWLTVDFTKERGTIVVTRDHGATWQTLSTLDNAESADWVSSADGRTVYAAVRTAIGPRLARSTDGGTTWTEVLALAHTGANGLVLPNGDVLLSPATTEGGLFRLRAGAPELEPLSGAPAHPAVLYVTGGVIVASQAWGEKEDPTLDPVASVSFDGGTTWVPVPV